MGKPLGSKCRGQSFELINQCVIYLFDVCFVGFFVCFLYSGIHQILLF